LGSSGSEGRSVHWLASAFSWFSGRVLKARTGLHGMVQSEYTGGGLFLHDCRNGNKYTKRQKICKNCRNLGGRSPSIYNIQKLILRLSGPSTRGVVFGCIASVLFQTRVVRHELVALAHHCAPSPFMLQALRSPLPRPARATLTLTLTIITILLIIVYCVPFSFLFTSNIRKLLTPHLPAFIFWESRRLGRNKTFH